MTLGFLQQLPKYNLYRLVDAGAADVVAPTTAADGIDISGLFGTFSRIDDCVLRLHSVAGSGTMTAAARLWGYCAGADKWYPTGVGLGTTKGIINAGVAIDETGSNTLLHTEPVYLLSCFDRIAVSTTLAGTGTSVVINLAVPRSAV